MTYTMRVAVPVIMMPITLMKIMIVIMVMIMIMHVGMLAASNASWSNINCTVRIKLRVLMAGMSARKR
jgi:hypothetical protein